LQQRLRAGQSANLSTCTDVLAFLISLVEEVSEIAGPIIQWSAAQREKQILKYGEKREWKCQISPGVDDVVVRPTAQDF
jgi:uncharacterized Tic20 family protein